ncbi:MAG: hypothetical protein AB7T63_07440 [Planctomycetota bacterium]
MTYVISFFVEWQGGCLWPFNDAAFRDFDFGPYDCFDPCPLPLSQATLDACSDLAAWHDKSLNWDYPPDPGPWRQVECDRFNAAAQALLALIRDELGAAFEVIDHSDPAAEDPDLDAYLSDPKGFRRPSS